MDKLSTSLCLVSAVIELVFFLVARTVLWFGFSMSIMLVTHWGFHCSSGMPTLRQGLFSLLCSASQQVHKNLGGSAQPGQLTQAGQITIPYRENHTQSIIQGEFFHKRGAVTAGGWIWASFGLGNCIEHCFSRVLFLFLSPSPFHCYCYYRWYY